MRALLLALLGCGAGDADGDGQAAIPHGGADCNDHDPAIYAGAREVCGGVDEDCDGLIDDLDPSLDPSSARLLHPDADGDGFGRDDAGELRCSGEGRAEIGGDCDDLHPEVWPGAPDRCDEVSDNDCDGQPDPGELDVDADGASPCGGDCDEGRADVHPAAVEICNGGLDDDCDGLTELDDPSVNPWTCGTCAPWKEWADTEVVETTTYDPCEIDPEATWGCGEANRLHRVAVRTDLAHLRPQLLLWLPPGPGRFNTKVLTMAAWAGYRSILLRYPNDGLAWGENCARDLGTCYADGRQEILWGTDTSPFLDIAWPDSAVGRAVALLNHLEAETPGEGWTEYIDPSGLDLAWDRIVVMGWSEGGTNLGWLAHEVEPYGVFFLSSPEEALYDVGQDLASYYYTPFATPACAMWGAYHIEESNLAFGLSYDAMGIPGDPVLVEESSAPYANSHRLTSALTDFGWDTCTHHEAMAFDPCMSDDLAEPYLHVLCAIGNQDRTTECPWIP